MAKRRANGEGNIRKRSDGRWEGWYTAGRDPDTGKVIYKNVLAKTQKECKEKLKQAIEENAKVDTIQAEQYTVGQWIDVWFDNYVKIKVRPSSHKTYRGYIDNHIKPSIGKIPLGKLSPLDLQKLYKKLLSGGRVERIESKNKSKGLSAKTVRNINQVISSTMDFAIDQKLITANPTDGCALPKLERREMKTLPTEQLASFLHGSKESGVFELYYIELATGLRRGELLGLKWEDIDLEEGTIQVRRQIARIEGEVVEAPLKTKNSYRSVSIGTDAAEILRNQQKKTSSEYVFPSPTGGPISPDSVLHMLHRVLKRAGLPRIRFHDMTHTFATVALQNGVDIKTVSGMLDHYSAGFTLDTYAHVTTQAQRQATDTMANILSGAVGN
ncbi:MAG: site-specific integrase [Oscillospiraceae bacterium]|nr:site-specific integrase [Oscillospiraceae bacterium]